MPNQYSIPIWKTSPFLRILPPLIAGILLQWYLQISLQQIIAGIICFTFSYLLFSFLPIAARYKLLSFRGIIFNLMLVSAGALLCWQKDVRHRNNWYGNFYRDSSYVLVRIDEPVVEKTKSYKADSYVEAVITNGITINCSGKLLLYFSKDSSVRQLQYGDKIIIRKNLQPIKNSGNPGSFNYQRYAAFQQTFHNVFLKEKDWTSTSEKNVNQMLFCLRGKARMDFRRFAMGDRVTDHCIAIRGVH